LILFLTLIHPLMKRKILEVVSIDLQILKSEPPILVITAEGNTASAGWTEGELNPYVYIMPPADGYYEFDFVAKPPSGPAGSVLTSIGAKTAWPDFPKNLKGVKIYGSKNSMKKELGNISVPIVSGGGGEFPRGIFYRNESARNLAVNALLNLKEKPAKLYVHGSVMTYRETDQVKLVKAVPQGINPAILLLNLEIKEGQGPLKPTPKHVVAEFSDNQVSGYNQVQVICGSEDACTINIEVSE
jgi:hypothetical protein